MRKGLFVSNLFPDAEESYRGLDNATVLDQLAGEFDFRVLSPRPSLALGKRAWQCREEDALFEPRYFPVGYVPKLGSLANHWLMYRGLKREMVRLHERFPFEFVLVSWLYPDGWAASKVGQELGIPVVTIAQGTDVHGYLRRPWRSGRVLEAVEQSAATITRSQSLADMLVKEGADGEKIFAIPNGTDTGVFQPRDQAEARRELGVALDAKVVLFVGNLLPVKNPGFLLEALSEISAELVLVGSGPLEASLRQRAGALGMAERVRFLGGLSSTKVAKWMNAADVLCLSSNNEGLPNVVIESLASGLPVVATAVGGIGELVDRPERGELVPVGNLRHFRMGIERVLERAFSEKSALGCFSWSQCANRYAEVLSRM